MRRHGPDKDGVPLWWKVVGRHFSPTADEVAHARKVVAADEAAEREWRASVGVDGKMVDIPVAERARRLLARAHAIEAKEARKRAAPEAFGEPGSERRRD